MSVCINLPSELEATLRREFVDLDQAAKEAFLLDLYRRERITRHELSVALGIDRFAIDDLLNRYGVTVDLPTAADVRREADELDARLGR